MPPAWFRPRESLLRAVRRHRGGILISFVVCVLSLSLYIALYLGGASHPALRFLATMELRALDMRFQLRGPREPSQRVVIVAIDQKSQDVFGRWPFPRRHFAEALDNLREAGARVVVLDVNFPQPDQNSALLAVRELRERYEKEVPPALRDPRYLASLKEMEAEADNDLKFAEALARYENAILGYFFMPVEETRTQDPERVQKFVELLSFQAYPQIIHPEFYDADRPGGPPAFAGLSPNLPELALRAKNFGYLNVLPDPDGVVRRASTIARFGDAFYPSLDIAAVLACLDLRLDEVRVVFNPNGLERIELGEMRIPTDPEGFVQIDFHGRAGTFPTYSLADIVQKKVPVGLLKDRLVVIGPTATGIADMAVTPFQTQAFPGVEVHASFMDNLLQGNFIRRGLRENLVDMAFLLLFSLGAGALLAVVPSIPATAVLIALSGFFLWLAYDLFATEKVWIAAFLPMATLIVNYAAIVSYRFFVEEREKKKVQSAFQQYVAPSIISQLLERPELLQLGGEEKELTALFSDIRGFTSLSEGLPPGELVEWLNEYLSEMTEVIFRHWGTLDKYIGDAIMAFWGAPYPQSDHPERACRAALEMLKVLEKLHTGWEPEGRPRMEIGIGIHTGPMLVGNMGSRRRFNFTIMGDNVNLASRLEGINKEFGTHLIISETTYKAVRSMMFVRELDYIRVKGKTRPVRIYELLATSEEGRRFDDLVTRFEAGLAAYRAARWEAAIETFEALLRDYPYDRPAQVLLRRCRDLMIQPPDGAWDGVYVMKTK